MDLETLETFFMWTTIFHYSILILWVLLFKFAGGWLRKQQTWWFPVPDAHYTSTHYLMYGGYKILVLVFSVIPYLALVTR